MTTIKTVKMHKPNQGDGLPSTADVHPNEVENWKSTGWQLCEATDAVKEEDESPLDDLPVKPKKRGRKKKSA